MKTAEIRKSYLDFFASKGHQAVASSSLVPAEDPTLLFVNSGMVQFKDCFLGTDKRPYTRATTVQKSLRISGKHNDLENVGRTARHHTFFEMLGNFSFGDYFKKDAISYAWEFLTKVLNLPKERLWITIYEDDDEAGELWQTLTDVLPGRILKCGKEDNFWAMGETGPCGPCTEIHYFLGSDLENQSEAEFRKGDGTYIEIWNLVFMQYSRDISGTLTPLPKPSVDTGMGLERVAGVKQGVLSNFDIDLFQDIIAVIEGLSKKKYLGKDYTYRSTADDKQYGIDVAMRIVADHVRSACFLIADGVFPSSDGRGYVLRRLIRRSVRQGRILGISELFLPKVAQKVIELMTEAYPELQKNSVKIINLLQSEEEKFLSTLDTGLEVLEKEVGSVKQKSSKTLSGEVAFLLHDTYGFPLDLTEDIVRLHGVTVDVEAFSIEMERQRERSRNARTKEFEIVLQKAVKALPTEFVGYEFTQYESEILGLFNKGGEVETAKAGEEIAVITRNTPFYGESGGQVGDAGFISSNTASIEVLDTKKVVGQTIVHICRVVEGDITKSTQVRLQIDENRRRQIELHHSVTHLLHQALREILGTHVKQAGSKVADSSLRFDFSHYEALHSSQILEIEKLVNRLIQDNYQVRTEILPIEQAQQTGAIALFGEKYGELVRVVQMGPGSREFCGGTHVKRTGDIGIFTLLAQASSSAGVRRVEACAGSVALKKYLDNKATIEQLESLLQSGGANLSEKILNLVERNRQLEKELERFQATSLKSIAQSLVGEVKETTAGIKVLAASVDNLNPKQLREISDDLKSRLDKCCLILSSINNEKAVYLVSVSEKLLDKFTAPDLLTKISSYTGSQGGGRKDLAQSGGGDPTKVKEALQAFQALFV